MRTWFNIKNDAGKDSASIAIFGDIDAATARDFIEQLKNLVDKNLTLRISSYGGDFFSALAIFNLLRGHRGKVETIIDGVCASAASLIACAGRVKMPGNAWMMVHGLTGGVDGETLKQMEKALVDAYMQKTKLPEESIRELIGAETWMDAPLALKLGFCDEITEPVALAARAELGKFKNLPDALKSAITSPTTGPTETLQLTRREANVIAKAESILRDAAEREQRAETLKQAAAIVELCANAGHMELSQGFLNRGLSLEEVRGELGKLTNIETATATGSPEEIKKIYAICQRAGVVDLAERFVAEAKTVSWVESRLADSDKIRARCLAAGMVHRADAFIRAGATPEEVGNNLIELKVSMQGEEIDNSISPSMMFGAEPGNHGSHGNGRALNIMSAQEIYKMRSRRPDGDAEKILAALKGALR